MPLALFVWCEDHNRPECAALLPMCEIADLPCACKRCAYLRPAYGCAVLVQALAHAQLLGVPRALAPCAQPILAAMLLRYKVRPCPVCASSARACALLSGVLCLCRHSHIDSPRHTSISSTRRFAILVICIHAPTMRWPLTCMHPFLRIIAQLSFVVDVSHHCFST